ncbi:MAG: Gfo/Idh/MocA family oxidoreductase [Pirellulales bacterium]|nr:Gfo/Idh/MocA family oxidoreductase [Pirellulales bacterium]
MQPQKRHSSRRDFLRQSAATGVGFWVAGGLAGKVSASPNEQLQIASFGVNGKGRSDVSNAARFGKIFALCDADRSFLDLSARTYKVPKENTFTDYRELFDKLGDKFDVVTVSTPDHTHAVILAKALRAGKHCYGQKPLTHSIWEARTLQELARQAGTVTQMGNQYTAFEPMRKAAYQIRGGQIGNVKEVHVWTNRPIWPQGEARGPEKEVPKELDWEAWIGPAPMRPYADGYHTFKWRGWWDFGTGALGDMACHTCNLPFMALNMRDPLSVEAETSGHNHDSYPAKSKIKFEFPSIGERQAFTFYWYDGTNLPPKDLYADFDKPNDKGEPWTLSTSGCLLVGDKATMYAAGDYAENGIFVNNGVELQDVDYPKPPGEPELGHVQEFYEAISDPKNKQATSNFADYAGPLTETILLGNLAVWKEGPVKWDAKTLTPDDPSLMKIVKPEYRSGYEL